MRELEKISEALFDKIRSRFDEVSIGDEKAKATLDPTKARFFNFDFDVDGNALGNITISLADQDALKVYFNKDITSEVTQETKQQWFAFLKDLRQFAKRNLLTFDTRDISKSNLQIRDLKHATKDADVFGSDEVNLGESRMYGTRRSSYQECGPAKIIVRHLGVVDEERRGDRSRHIGSVFIENSEGERFKMPFTSLSGARAMARHVSEGGSVYDELGEHICQVVSEMGELKHFVRSMRGRVFEDDETQGMVEAAVNHYGKLHQTLHQLKGKKGYRAYTGTWQPQTAADEQIDMDALKERFVKKVFDDRLMDALPIVYRAYADSKCKMSEEFESWADSVISGDNERGFEEADIDVGTGGAGEPEVDQILNAGDVHYRVLDGVYYFDSKEEMSRAKDLIAAENPELGYPEMGVKDYTYGIYGPTGGQAQTQLDGPNVPIHNESIDSDNDLSFLRKLAGL